MPAVVPFIPLIAAGVGAGTSLIGGGMAASAAKNAARIQAQAAAQAAQEARNLLPTVNQPIGAATSEAQQRALDAANAAAGGVTSAAQAGQSSIIGAGLSANELLAPYLKLGGQATGTLADLMGPGGELNKTFTAADMQAFDPGYAFRMEQASKALQGSAAARGGALGGGTLQALSSLNQNLASSEYGAAFNRFSQQQQDRFNRLNTLVNMGSLMSGRAGANLIGTQETAGQMGLEGARLAGGFGTQGAQYAGDVGMTGAQRQAANALDIQRMITEALTGGANAQAAGQIGSGNAWQTALQGVGGAAGQVGSYYQQQELLKKLKEIMSGGYA
jgi:hypothetical protein